MSYNIVVLVLLACCCVLGCPPQFAEPVRELFTELKMSRGMTSISPRLSALIQQYRQQGFQSSNLLSSIQVDAKCILCNAAVKELLDYYFLSGSKTKTRDLAVDVCTTFNISTDAVCSGIVDIYTDLFIYLAEHVDRDNLASDLCSLLVNSDPCVFAEEWTLEKDLGEKPEAGRSSSLSNDTMTIIHISDIHYDPKYVVGNNADCKEPTCCRKDEGVGNTSSAAGFWGDYRNCDVPRHTIENMLQHIKQQHQDLDYIYVTGDYVDHGVWETSKESNTKTITEVTEMFKQYFSDVPIIFTLGNHESSPVNTFSPLDVDDDVSTNWVYELVSDLWSPWLTEEAQQSILKGGFYTLKIRDGFRIIVLNSMPCYSFNLWLAYNSSDPYGQLSWLADTLLQAESDGELVHLLYHIPPGNVDCVPVWSREFHKITDRFQNIIQAQFNGHTHSDEFHIVYSIEDESRATNIMFNGGSGTTYSNVNGNYKVYSVDTATLFVVDAEAWTFNVTAANSNPDESPGWYKLYSFKSAFDVENLSPSEVDLLAHEMAKNHSLLYNYFRFYVKNGDPSLQQGCDDECLKEKLCDIVTAQRGDTAKCDELLAEYSDADNSSPADPIVGLLQNMFSSGK